MGAHGSQLQSRGITNPAGRSSDEHHFILHADEPDKKIITMLPPGYTRLQTRIARLYLFMAKQNQEKGL